MREYSEDAMVERPAIAKCDKRETVAQVMLVQRLQVALERINPEVLAEALELAGEELARDRSALSAAHANRDVYLLLKEGVTVRLRVGGDDEGNYEETDSIANSRGAL